MEIWNGLKYTVKSGLSGISVFRTNHFSDILNQSIYSQAYPDTSASSSRTPACWDIILGSLNQNPVFSLQLPDRNSFFFWKLVHSRLKHLLYK